MPSSRKRIAAALGLGVAVSGLSLVALPAHAVSTGLVISEVYGGGGNTGANLNADFVELFNPTDAPLTLDGHSLQYRSSGGTGAANGTASLSGTVAAGEHYLIQTGPDGDPDGDPLPEPDATVTGVNMGAASGTIYLADVTTPLTLPTGSIPNAGSAADDDVIDLVGFGETNTFETSPTATLSATTSASRTAVDSDNNSTNFAVGAQTPENSGDAEPEPPADPEDATIAEIQGTGDTSPLEGEVVTTEGVVTARYPTGGYNGFYIQTEGSGGSDDTPGASDAVFVYGPNVDESTLEIGELVEVTGEVSEFFGTTEITPEADGVTPLEGEVDPVEPWTAALPNSEAGREAHEGELMAPEGQFTVTNTYSLNQFGDIGLAKGSTPLIQPTEVADAQDTEAIEEIEADNARRAVVLDDGASINFFNQANKRIPLPYLSTSNPIRVGAAVTFTEPVILEFRNDTWKFQPDEPLTAEGTPPATFENTRTPAPEDVGGDTRLAAFNVLNYFTTTAEEFVDSGGSCTTYDDRFGNPITANQCTPDGPRGAANEVNLERQEVKIVKAINALDASVVGLQELENSVKFDKDRDDALSRLVDALNADLGSDGWAYAPSPAPGDMPTPAQEDVIRTAFIYRTADIELVGPSEILIDEENFDNAREPLAQAFKPAGSSDDNAFLAIVNHFKSKGSGVDDGTGQGNANPDRIGQAEALSDFAADVATDRDTDAVFLMGDFNAYTMEDPMQVLYGDGYTQVDSDTADEETYSFSGLSGSLDHVLANDAALEMVTGADIWGINSGESVALEYSRYNYNRTIFYEPDVFRASDHDPVVVGLDLPGTGTQEIQILATNDFHGRIANDPFSSAAGAGAMAGAVKQLRQENPNTVFSAAGDLIGASTFDSFIANDKPTIDALNEAGLEVSAVGNHEFDQGYDDLVNRVMAEYDETDNPEGGAEWEYLGANVKFRDTGDDALEGTWMKEMSGVQVGFVGTVTEHLPELVSPDGIAEIEVTDIVEATNAAADDLEAEGADVVIMLVHEGAGGPDCATMDVDPTSDFGSIITGVNDNVDAIVSGHTHLEYNCSFPVDGWADREVTERPVVSAGQYGANLNQLVFTVDEATGQVTDKSQAVLKLKAANGGPFNYPVDEPTQEIVDEAVAEAEVLGAEPLGEIDGAFDRARFDGGTSENRGGESTLGNLVAEVQRWATESETAGGAQIAFMNPGGLRADMRGDEAEAFPRTLTYRQAATVQPFANTLVNMDLTGAQLKEVLEEQWQPAGSSRPFLRLGVSEGFTHTYDPDGAEGDRITGMWLHDEPIEMTESYSVTVNSFIAAGGDNFSTFADVAGKQDTGQTDLQAMVDYMAEFADPDAGDPPLPVDYSQRAVGISFPVGAPEAYAPGDDVEFDVSSLSMTSPNDLQDEEIEVSLDEEVLGTFDVTTTLSPPADANSNDEAGQASVLVVLPDSVPEGSVELTLTGVETGTEMPVLLEVGEGMVDGEMAVDHKPNNVIAKKTRAKLMVDVTADGVTPTGRVEVRYLGDVLRAGQLNNNGSKTFTLPKFNKKGEKALNVVYLGDDNVNSVRQRYVIKVKPAK